MSIGKLNPFNSETDDFDSWVGVLGNFLLANGVDKADSDGAKRAVAILLSSIGIPTYTLLTDMLSPVKPETKTLDELVAALQIHFKPAPKAIAERFKFTGRTQKSGESVNVFMTELRKLASTCKFKDLDERLRDQFVFGLGSAQAQKVLFTKDDDVKLAEVVKVALSQELAETSTQIIRTGKAVMSTPSADDLITCKVGKKGQFKKPFKSQQPQSRSGPSGQSKCPNCGSNHNRNECPHREVECYNCHKKGHFSKYCKSGKKSTFQHNNKQVGQVESVQSINQASNVKQIRRANPPIMLQVLVNGREHKMELDTASGPSFLNSQFWRSLGKPKLKPSKQTFTTFTGEEFKSIGYFEVELSYNRQKRNVELEVSDGSSLFGRNFVRLFQMDWENIKTQCQPVKQLKSTNNPTRHFLMTEFEDVFDKTTGVIRNFKAKLVLKDDATPRFFKARPVPFAIRSKVDAELEKMEQTGAITKIEHSDWASPLVVVPKLNGKVRITGDFKKTVNSQLCVTQYPLARHEDLFECVAGGQKFTKLDATDAYHQVEMEESCKKFLVINTHRGLYRYNVLPQGIASSPAIFQELVDKMLKGIPMSGSFIDDSICSGRNDKEHIANLRAVLQRMREYNFRLDSKKCCIMQDSIKYLGQVLSQDGIRPDPEKVEAVSNMRKPGNASEVKSFLGLVNFYARFIPHLSTISEPLNRLTRSDVNWNWTNECAKAFSKIKMLLSSSSVLAHFQQSLPVGIACDASPVGVGVVLFHKYPDGSERPIAFASKTLSSAERNYPQIDREGLSIVYGIKRFFQFLYGRRFTLVTDHEPLLAIFGEKTHLPPLVATRLHRWSLFLSGFSFDVIYRNTTKHGNADALSRLPLPVNCPVEQEAKEFVKQIIQDNPVTSKAIRFRTSRDPVLSHVIRFAKNGWPSKQEQVPEKVRPFFPHRFEYTLEEGILLWGIRVVVPSSLRFQVLCQVHDTHPGIVRMKSIARQYVWWPGIDSDIEKTAKSCKECAIHRDNPAEAPVHPWVFPEKPWQRLHIDLAGPFLNNMWLIIVDAHSKWPEVYKLGNDSTSSSVITRIRETFSRFGIPQTIVSDNGTQFTSEEFNQFCAKNGVRHTTSSAYHPRSNGAAERFIRSFKSAMSKGKGNANLNLCNFLLTYRVTPHATTGVSPSDMLLKVKPRTLLDLLRPDPNSRVRTKQEVQVESTSGHRICRDFNPGDSVWVQSFSKNSPKWSLGKIKSAVGPVSYNVQVEERIMKRHVDHILLAEVSTFVQSPEAGTSSPSLKKPTTPQREPRQSPTTKSPEFKSAETSPAIRVIPMEDLSESESDPEEEPSLNSTRPQRSRREPDRLTYPKF